MSCGSIYKIVFPNGKHYIGLTTTSLEQRTKEHKQCAKNGDTKCLYNAIRKYKLVDTLELLEIDTADTMEELCEKEIRYINEYYSYYMNGCGYNMTYGGDGTFGYVYTEEVRQKISASGKKFHEDNPEAGIEHSKRMRKYFENPEAREKNRQAQKKRFEKPEASQKISQSQKKRFEKPEEIYNLLNARGKNKPFDVFTKDGTFVKTFNYQFDAIEYLQTEKKITSTIKIGDVLRGKRNNSAGFVFKYK